MATTTPNLGLTKPVVGASADTWGSEINASLDTLDAKVLDKTTGGTVTGNLSVTGTTSLQALSATTINATGNAVISTSSANPALRITQTGTGEALRVEDETNPDATPFVIDAAGNVGVGTSAPGANNRLTIDGGRLVVSNGPVGAGNTSSVKGVQTYFDATNNIGYIYSTQSGVANYPLSLNGSIIDLGGRATLTQGGNLLVGTATDNGAGGFTITPNSSGGAGTAAATVVWNRNNTTNTSIAATFLNAGSTVGNITFTNTATAYNTSSDYRLKNNQQPLTGSGAFIDALAPKTWEWSADGSRGVGFIAHEVQAVSPGSVTGEKDAVDADGKPVYQAMEYGSAEFIANIVAELQSLRKRLAALEAK